MKTNLSKEMDSEMLFELVRKADTDKDAAFKLGVMYLNGNNVCQDTQRALFYFQQASELGHSGVEAIYASCINVVLLILSLIYLKRLNILSLQVFLIMEMR